MAKLYFALILVTFAVATLAEEPNIRLYFVLPIGEGHINLYKKYEPNVSEWAQYLEVSHAYCWVGWWQFWDSNDDLVISTGYSVGLENCGDGIGVVSKFHTGRFLGPANSSTEAIALYLPGNEGNAFGGAEHIVETEADDVLFTAFPSGLITFGFSNWTLFEGKNYTGNSRCFESKQLVESLELDFSVHSVVKGCDKFEIKKYVNLEMN